MKQISKMRSIHASCFFSCFSPSSSHSLYTPSLTYAEQTDFSFLIVFLLFMFLL